MQKYNLILNINFKEPIFLENNWVNLHFEFYMSTMIEIKHNLQSFIIQHNFSSIVIIADETVWNYYPNYFDFIKEKKIIIPIIISEKIKNLATCELIWQKMSDAQVDREALCINFGGGIISDIGGFAASIYKRGIKVVNIPTTLLAMIDAAIGGKNGINFNHIKNMIGTFHFPEKVFIDKNLLKTLTHNELLNGFGELIKYALITKRDLWNEIKQIPSLSADEIKQTWIDKAVSFKAEVVKIDPFDKNERQILNVGHTIGHAIESFYLKKGDEISHGNAVAIGTVFEIYLSNYKKLVSTKLAEEISNFIKRFFTIPTFTKTESLEIASYISNDKKTMLQTVFLPLLNDIGKISLKQKVEIAEIVEILQNDLR